MKAKLLSQVSQERLELHRAIPLSTPLVIYIEPSGYCNLKCAFCPVGIEDQSLTKDMMPLALFEKMVCDIAGFEKRVKLLRFCGNGEPLMNKDIIKMLKQAKEQNSADRIEMLTNGILLSPDLTTLLPRYLDRIIISIEGLSSDDYKSICSTKIRFEKLLYHLDALFASKGDCKIHIKVHHEAVVTKEKEDFFYSTFRKRCDEIFIEKLVPMWPQLDSVHFAHEFRWSEDAVINRKVCAQIFKGVQVQANGEVVPCCVDWKRVNVLGNINNVSLSEIWNGDKLRQLQIRHLSGRKGFTEPCKDCTMNDYCEYDNIDHFADECLVRLTGAN